MSPSFIPGCAARRRAMLLAAAGLSALALLAGCFTPQSKRPDIDPAQVSQEAEKQREYTVRQFLKNKQRVDKVSWRVLTYSAPICKSTRNKVGMSVMSIYDMSKEFRSAYAKALAMSDGLTIIDVYPDGPAERAGLMVGDVIVGVEDNEVPRGTTARSTFTKLFGQALTKGGAVNLRINRGGAEMSAPLGTELACSPDVFVVEDSTVNAYADGKNIVVNTGLLRFMENDDELALIIGHELAHNDLGHIKAQNANAITGAILGGIVTAVTGVNVVNGFAKTGSGAFSQEFEHEADYVGIYLSARAGYDITFAPDLWRRMGAEHPAAITRGSTHPPTAERFVALENAVKEIREKQAKGQAVEPNYKK